MMRAHTPFSASLRVLTRRTSATLCAPRLPARTRAACVCGWARARACVSRSSKGRFVRKTLLAPARALALCTPFLSLLSTAPITPPVNPSHAPSTPAKTKLPRQHRNITGPGHAAHAVRAGVLPDRARQVLQDLRDEPGGQPERQRAEVSRQVYGPVPGRALFSRLVSVVSFPPSSCCSRARRPVFLTENASENPSNQNPQIQQATNVVTKSVLSQQGMN